MNTNYTHRVNYNLITIFFWFFWFMELKLQVYWLQRKSQAYLTIAYKVIVYKIIVYKLSSTGYQLTIRCLLDKHVLKTCKLDWIAM